MLEGAGGNIGVSVGEDGIFVIDNETKIIPGHGELSTKEDYKNFLTMLETLRTNIQKAIDEGKTEDEVKVDSSLTKTYDDLDFGGGFINSEKNRVTFYKSLKGKQS